MGTICRKKRMLVAGALGVIVMGITAYAAVNNTIAVGTTDYSEFVDGPATITMRTLTIAPEEVLGWHHHPGIGAITIVKQGTLTIEDGCGGETVYLTGDAFLEPPGRVHRGKNLDAVEDVITAQTFVVPFGDPNSVSSAQLCGAPASVAECRRDGWADFNHPRTFANQGDCEQFLITGK
jgi:quercetin dioxygenase-like cupin family protein